MSIKLKVSGLFLIMFMTFIVLGTNMSMHHFQVENIQNTIASSTDSREKRVYTHSNTTNTLVQDNISTDAVNDKIGNESNRSGERAIRYIIKVNEETAASQSFENSIKDITDKIKNFGVTVEIKEEVGIFFISSTNQQLLANIIEELEQDPRIEYVERDAPVGIGPVQ
jgi:hypothetical protein